MINRARSGLGFDKPKLIKATKPKLNLLSGSGAGWGFLPKNVKYYMKENSSVAYDYLGYLDTYYPHVKAVHVFGNFNEKSEEVTFYTIKELKSGEIPDAYIPYIESPTPQESPESTTGGKKSNRTKSKRSNKNQTRKTI
jgi:hypothetical protein